MSPYLKNQWIIGLNLSMRGQIGHPGSDLGVGYVGPDPWRQISKAANNIIKFI